MTGIPTLARVRRAWTTRRARPGGPIRSWPWLALSLAFAVLAALTLTLERSAAATLEQGEQAQWWRAHSLDVLISTEQLDTALNRTLRGERGFVLTRQPKSLATYRQGLTDYARLSRRVRYATRDNPSQQRRLATLDRRVLELERVSRDVIDRVRLNDQASALAMVRTGPDLEAVEAASLILGRIKAEERRLLTQREAWNAALIERNERFARTIFKAALAMLVLVTGLIAAMVRARAIAARAVRTSERLYRLMAEHSNDMIVCIGLDGRRRYVSPASQALLGYRPEEMTGGRYVADIHVEDVLCVFEAMRTLLSGGGRPICSYRQQHRDGRYVWLEASYQLIHDAVGRPVEFVASVRDIGRRHAIEVRAAAAAARLDDKNRLFVMAASLARIKHWRIDLIRNQVKWSSEGHRLHQHHEYFPSLEHAIAPYHPDDGETVRRVIEEAIATGRPFAFSARLLPAGGEIKAVAVQGQVERAPDGRITGVFGVTQDVSAQVEAQRALRESELRYRLLADNAADVVLRTDEAGVVTYISPSCVDLSGFTADELMGKRCADFIHPDDRANVRAARRAILTGARDGVTIEYRLKHQRDGWRWLEAHMKRWRSPEGSGDVISSLRDIARRKVLETELVEARDAAEAAARAKSAFLANMSHEIRTPMNGVLGFTELLLSGEQNPQQRRHLELIAESGRSMMRLLNDILDVSRIDAGKMQVIEEPVDLPEVVGRCAALMEPVAVAKGVALATAIDAAMPSRIVSDPLLLRQILLNLIGNALKFTERGTVQLRGFVKDHRLRLDVIDTGIGIAPDRLGAIFERFAQADERTGGQYGGTGLGLAISGNLARLLGGSISVRSVVGEGSTFSLILPLRPVEDSATIAPPVDRRARAAIPSAAPRVLIAEDHDINRVLISAMAERAGMAAQIAGDGAEAIAMVDEAARTGRPFDLVLMDMRMPGMDGLEATRRLRAAGYRPDTLPIVALTANAYDEDVRACRDAGMQDHLAKPVRVRDLVGLLKRFAAPERGEPVPASVSAVSARLRAQYDGRKLKTIEMLDALIAALCPDTVILAEAADMLHKLAGVAGMFGEAELGQRAKRLEESLAAWSVSERTARIRSAVDHLREAV